MTDELVSIVIPAYFADQYLAETLAGISRQTYRSWEVILVEDGSVTETEHIVREFSHTHPNNRVVYDRLETNRGQSAARNRAISLSEGKFIALLDADDVWLPEHLSSSLKLLAVPEFELCFSTSIMFDDGTQRLTGLWGPDDFELEELPLSLLRRVYVTPSSVVMKRSVLEKTGQFDEDRNLQGTEDYDFWLRSIVSGVQFVHLSGAYCLYRKGHPTAATSNMPLITKRMNYVLGNHIDRISGFSDKKKAKLLSKSHATAGYFNIGSDLDYSRRAYFRAWQLRPGHISYAIFAAAYWLGQYFPGLSQLTKLIRDKIRS